uniref:Proteoglycan 4-like n=1 Tax=Panagrellus redivivus TaxID=6233 RepID=A0A7E4W6R2_PANRE
MGGCTSRKQVARTFATPRPPASARAGPSSSGSAAGVVAGKSVGRKSSSSGGQESSKTAEAEPESEVGQKGGQPRPLPPKEVVQQPRGVMPPPPPQNETPVAVGVAPARTAPTKQGEKPLPPAPAPTPAEEDMRFDLETQPKLPDSVHEGPTSIAPRRTSTPSTAAAAAAATRLRSGTPPSAPVRTTNTPTEKTMKVFAATGTPSRNGQSPVSNDYTNSAKLFGKPMIATSVVRNSNPTSRKLSADVATPTQREARKQKPTSQRSKTPPAERPKTPAKSQRTRANPSRTPVIEPTQADDDDEEGKVEIFNLVIPGIEPISTKTSQKSRSIRDRRIGASDCVQLLSPKASMPAYDDFSPLPVLQFESEDENVGVEQQNHHRRKSPVAVSTPRGANARGHAKCGCKCKPEEHTLYDVSEEIRDLHFDLISDNSL